MKGNLRSKNGTMLPGRCVCSAVFVLFLLGAIVSIFSIYFKHNFTINGIIIHEDLENAEELLIRSRLEEAEATWLRGRNKINEARPDYLALQPFPWKHSNVRSFWDFFYANFDCPHITQRVGRLGGGGKWVCGLNHLKKKKKPCVVYSYGVDSETTFEEEMLQLTNCSVFMYDHTVNAKNLNWLKLYPERAIFNQLDIGVNNTVNLKTLKTEMDKHQHNFIDILKMDIEGAEYGSLAQIKSDFPQGFPFGQLLVELHTTPFPNNGMLGKLMKWYQMLEDSGLRAFKNEPNWICLRQCVEFAFINTAVDNFFLHAYHTDSEN